LIMSCPKCNSFDYRTFKSGNHVLHLCNVCGRIFGEYYEKDYCCGNKRLEIVKYQISNGQYRKAKMCINCMKSFGNVKNDPNHFISVSYDEREEIKRRRDGEVGNLFEQINKSRPPFHSYYRNYLQSNEWKKKRLERLKLDGFKCQMCHQHKGQLDVHHTTYDTLYNENINDLITLCRPCHAKIHQHDND